MRDLLVIMTHFWQPLRSSFLALLLLMLASPLSAQNFERGVHAYDEGDYHEAFQIFYQLGELGHADALNNLGALYQTGKGTQVNYRYAILAYERAAQAGHIDAAYNASNLTRLGIGTRKDMGRAYTWAILAGRHGASDMIAYRDILKEKLTAEELARGLDLAHSLLEPLSTQELAIAWLIPSELSNPLPTHLQTAAKRTSDLVTKERTRSSSSLQNPPLKEEQIPEGFTAIRPQETSTEKRASLPKNPTIPDGFTALKPQNRATEQNSFSNEDITKATAATALAIPEGFSALTPNRARAGKSHFDDQDAKQFYFPQDRPEELTTDSPLSALFKEGYTLLTPIQEQEKQEAKRGEQEELSKGRYDLNRTYPTALGQYGETIYRPQSLKKEFEDMTILRPRRVIPPQELTLATDFEMSDELNIIVTNIARAHNIPFNQTFEALLKENRENIQADELGIFTITQPDRALIIPELGEIPPTS